MWVFLGQTGQYTDMKLFQYGCIFCAGISAGTPDRALMCETAPTTPRRHHLSILEVVSSRYGFLPAPPCLSGRELTRGPSLPRRVAPATGACIGSRPKPPECLGGSSFHPAARRAEGPTRSPFPLAPVVVWPFGWRTLGGLGVGVLCATGYPSDLTPLRLRGVRARYAGARL